MKSVSDLMARVACIRGAQKKIKQFPQVERKENLLVESKFNEASKLERLPLWPELVRAVPNGFLRSALFGVIGKGKRRYMRGERIASLDGIDISYTGERLDQGDLDLWENVLHIARLQPLGEQCRITSYALLKLLGKTDTGKNRAALKTRIERLRANAVTMKQGQFTFIGGLVDEAYKDEKTQEWLIVVNPKLNVLYNVDQFTQVDWKVRHALNGNQFAQWLHGFYVSHANPYPIRVETLLKLCGSENVNLRSAKQTLRKALDALFNLYMVHGRKFDYIIRNNLVFVKKQAIRHQKMTPRSKMK